MNQNQTTIDTTIDPQALIAIGSKRVVERDGFKVEVEIISSVPDDLPNHKLTRYTCSYKFWDRGVLIDSGNEYSPAPLNYPLCDWNVAQLLEFMAVNKKVSPIRSDELSLVVEYLESEPCKLCSERTHNDDLWYGVCRGCRE